MDEVELGEVLRGRRKAAGRTIASVAMDAGLSVPYIANLENGRGNPTVAALDRLATALGARLQITIAEGESPASAPASASDSTARLLAEVPRGGQVVNALASAQGRSRRAVQQQLVATLDSLAELLPSPPTESDLNRLLDLILLSTDSLRPKK